MTLRLKGREVSLRIFVDGEEVETAPALLENVEITLNTPSATQPARTSLTFEDFVAAKAPLDHAPCPGVPYVFVDSKWVQDWPMPPGMAPMRRELDAMAALWCYSVSQKLGD